MTFIQIILVLVLGYLVGSIPFAFVVAKMAKGVDIRKVGTGNPGAANVYREVGKPYGILVWFLDTFKGVVPMLLGGRVFHLPVIVVAAAGGAAIAGHCWSLFLKFKGGKGVATMGGVTVYLFPLLFPLGAVLYFWVQKTGRKFPIIYMALGIFFLFTYFLHHQDRLILFARDYFFPRKGVEAALSMLILFVVTILANISTIKELREARRS